MREGTLNADNKGDKHEKGNANIGGGEKNREL